MSDWKTAADWAGMALKGLPSTKRGIAKLADRDGWQQRGPDFARKRAGRGGGWEYNLKCLPVEARADWDRRHAVEAVAAKQVAITRAAEAVKDIDARRRQIMDARAAVLIEIERRAALAGSSFGAAVEAYLADAKVGLLPEHQAEALRRSVEKSRGKPPSRPTLYNWRAAYAAGGPRALAPEVRAQESRQAVPEWLGEFIRFYAVPANPTMAHALDRYARSLEDPRAAPSYAQVKRAMKGLKASDRFLEAYKGREGPLALKARLMFTRRTLEGMEPTIIYTADGKTFDAEIAHPVHGRPFRPEITTIVDVVTRKIVGWSVDLAENSRAVSDALRHACETHGIPAIFYTDRGPGYRNAELDHATLGLCARLGITTTHSLPYNSQARGIIERVNGSVWNKVAKEFVTYMGADMDREARQRVHKQTRRELKEFGTSKTLPGFETFLAVMQEHVAAYNDAVHASLKIKDPITGRQRRATPNEVWADFVARGFEPFRVTGVEADDLFRPHVIRRTTRGEVSWIGNQYANEALERYHGRDVLVGYDIHDGNRVWVRELEERDGEPVPGRLICVAEFWHNKARYMPVAFTEHAQEKRVEGQLKRLDEKRDRALADLRAPDLIEAPKEAPLPPVADRLPAEAIEALRGSDDGARVVAFEKRAAAQPRRDPRNPMNDPDLALAWAIVDSPLETDIPPHHVALMRDLLGNLGMVQMMRDVQLPLAALEARLEAAAEPLTSSIRR